MTSKEWYNENFNTLVGMFAGFEKIVLTFEHATGTAPSKDNFTTIINMGMDAWLTSNNNKIKRVLERYGTVHEKGDPEC